MRSESSGAIASTYAFTSSYIAGSSMTTARYSLVNSSRITRTTSGGSRYSSVPGFDRDASSEICRHWSCSRARSRASSSAVAPSAAVRTISPAFSGRIPSSTLRSRLRSSSGSRLEMP